MGILKFIAYILGGIFIFFGVLFVWAAFGEVFNSGWLLTGIITIGIGFGLIIVGYFVGKRAAEEARASEPATYKIDLSGGVNLDTLKCESCGGVLTSENIEMVAGAPMVSCPYCGTTYQLTEEPKW